VKTLSKAVKTLLKAGENIVEGMKKMLLRPDNHWKNIVRKMFSATYPTMG
jgi:hypothetical protein